jgi:hypothetical protein
MNNIKERLIKQAQERYNKIFPCSSKQTLDDSFTIENNKIFFWFNTEDKSTHVLMEIVK